MTKDTVTISRELAELISVELGMWHDTVMAHSLRERADEIARVGVQLWDAMKVDNAEEHASPHA